MVKSEIKAEKVNRRDIGKLTIPLGNFNRSRSSIIDLGGPRIVPIEDTSLSNVPEGVKYCLEIDSIEEEKPRRTLDRILIVFKLFKDRLVLSNRILAGNKIIDKLPHYIHWVDEDRGVPLYCLNEYEESTFCEFWKEFFEIDYANFAVNRFHLADYMVYSTDRFVNYVETLEYLFVPDSGEGEILYKLRSRGAQILGKNKNPDDRKNIYLELKHAYNLRSAIVHGKTSKEINKLLRNKTWEENIRPIRCYSREAIKFFFRAKRLDNAEERRKLMEKMLIFESEIK
jgi:hypothetical protein